MSALPPAILVLGPTAGGKTAVSIALARRLRGGGECLCADSMQVYRGMDIGTAKPTPDEQAAAPHHLLNLVDPSDDGFSVDTWLRRAEETIADVRGRQRWPIIVGGTNLYIQAFLEGLFDGPAPDPAVRADLAARPDAALRVQLETVDPAAAARIHPNDRKRTVRALEVHATTGQRMSDLQAQWNRGRVREDVLVLGLEWPTDAINRRINARVRAMLDAGLVEEVRRLHDDGRLGEQARAALGYRQIIDHLEGRTTLAEAVEQIKIRTRRFAKQQRTWLRRFRAHPRSIWIAAADHDPESLAATALESIDRTVAGSSPAAAIRDEETPFPSADA